MSGGKVRRDLGRGGTEEVEEDEERNLSEPHISRSTEYSWERNSPVREECGIYRISEKVGLAS